MPDPDDKKTGLPANGSGLIEPLPWWFRPYVFIPLSAACLLAVGFGFMAKWVEHRFWRDDFPYFFKGFGSYMGTGSYATLKITLWLCGLAAALALLSGGKQSRASLSVMRRRFRPCLVHLAVFVATWIYLMFFWPYSWKFIRYGGLPLYMAASLAYLGLFLTALWSRRCSLKTRAALLISIALIWPFLLPPS